MMNEPLSQVSDTVVNNAATIRNVAAGVAVALMSNPPKIATRFYYWLRYSHEALTNPNEKEIFESFYNGVEKIRNELGHVAYQQGLENCLNLYKSQLAPDHPVYHFTPLPNFDIDKIARELPLSELIINGKRLPLEHLLLTVVNKLTAFSFMKKDATLSIPKIIFSFLVSMCLEFTSIDNQIEKRELVHLMLKVAELALGNDKTRSQFESKWFNVFYETSRPTLIHIVGEFQNYLDNEYHLADADRISNAVKAFKNHQVEIAKKTLLAGLVMFEGGRLERMSLDFSKLASGDLSSGTESKIPFSENNPFAELFKQCARLFPMIDTSYLLEFNYDDFRIPEKGQIKRYIRDNINSSPSILYPLLRKKINQNRQTYEMISTEEDINHLTDNLYKFADYLRKHAVLAIIAAQFVFASEDIKKHWYDDAAKFIEQFMKDYEADLSTNEKFLDKELKSHITFCLGGIDKNTHDILNLISSITKGFRGLVQEGITPLKSFKEYKLRISPARESVQQNLLSFIQKATGQLLFIGMGTPSPSSTLSALPQQDTSRLCLKQILNLLLTFAKHSDNQYQFRNPDALDEALKLPKDDTRPCNYYGLKDNEKHKTRMELFYELFKKIYQINISDQEKLREINEKISEAKNKDKDTKYFASAKLPSIQVVLDQVQQIIGSFFAFTLEEDRKFSAQRTPALEKPPSLPPQDNTLTKEVKKRSSSSQDCDQKNHEVVIEIPPPLTALNTEKEENLPLQTYNFVYFLMQIIDQVAKKQEKYEAFQVFWTELCYLNKDEGWLAYIPFIESQSDYSKMKEYHEKLSQLKKSVAQHAQLSEIRSALDSKNVEKMEWAQRQLKCLKEYENITEIDQKKVMLDNRIGRVHEDKITLELELTHYCRTKLLQDTHLTDVSAWDAKRKKMLSTDLKKYAQDASLPHSEPSIALVLHQITARLMTNDIAEVEGKEHAAINQEFSELLRKNISAFFRATESEKKFREVVVSGLLMLGANHRALIHDFLNPQVSNVLPQNILDITKIFSRLTHVILSQIVNRSKHQNDCATFLSHEISELVKAIHAFVHKIEYTANSGFYALRFTDFVSKKFGRSTSFTESAMASEHRSDRASLYFSVINLIEVIWNEQLVKWDENPKEARNSDEYAAAMKQYYQLKTTCKDNLKNHSTLGGVLHLILNIGDAGYNEFQTLIKAVDNLMESVKIIAYNRATQAAIQAQMAETQARIAETNLRLKAEADVAALRESNKKKSAEIESMHEKNIRGAKYCINNYLNDWTSKNAIAPNAITRLKMELLNHLLLCCPAFDDHQERALLCIDECINIHPRTVNVATALNRVGMFAFGAASGGTEDVQNVEPAIRHP